MHANRSTANLIRICHFQHYFNPQGGWHEVTGGHKSTLKRFYQNDQENSADTLKIKCKINSSKQDFGLGMNIDGTKQYTNEYVPSTPWAKNVPPEVKAGLSAPRLIPTRHQAPLTTTGLQPHTYPVWSRRAKRRKVHNQNFSTTLSVFIRQSVWRLRLEGFRDAFHVLVLKEGSSSLKQGESNISQYQAGKKCNHDNRF